MGERPEWFREDLFPFESRFVDADGAKIHYVDEGTGPTILMHHGNPTWSFLYRHVIAGLSDRFRCVALDYPGFGLSTAGPGYGYTAAEHAAVVTGFIEALDLRDYTPFVQDWGGPIGLGAAVRDPGRVRALIVGNTFAWPMDRDPGSQVFSRVLGGPAGNLLVRRLGIFTNVFVPRMRGHSRLGPGEMAMYRGPHPDAASRRPVHVMPREILAASDFLRDLEGQLAVFAGLPALLLWANADPAFRPPQRTRWEQHLPNATTVLLEGAGHYFQDDVPDQVVTAVREWFPQ